MAVSPSAEWGIFETGGDATLNRWNGSTWSTFQTPPSNDSLCALAVLSANDVWAVGSQTLAVLTSNG